MPSVSESGDEVIVVYTAVSSDDPSVESVKEVKLNVVKKGDLSRYFYGEGITYSSDEDSVSFTSEGITSVKYVNPLPAFNFSIDFAFSYGNSVKLTLRDSVNTDESVSFELRRDPNGVLIYLNGRYVKQERTTFCNTLWSLYYNDLDFTFRNDVGKVLASIRDTLSGKSFEGFGSQRIYLEIEFDCAEGGSLTVPYLCGQVFSSDSSDYVNPVELIEFDREVAFQSSFVVPRIIVADVLSPDCGGMLTIYAPDNSILYDRVPIDGEYTVSCDAYGQYILQYRIFDGAQNSIDRSFIVYVRDKTAPSLEVKGKVPDSAKIGKTISLPKAEVSDNHDTDLKATVWITAPNGTVEVAEAGGSFCPKQKGIYHIRYYVQDAGYNYSMKEYTLSVS